MEVDDPISCSLLSAAQAVRLLSAVGDIVLVVDADGIVRSGASARSEATAARPGDWVGRPWIETVTRESRTQVRTILEEVATTGLSRTRQLEHRSDSGAVIPVAYTAATLGANGRVLGVGRELRGPSTMQQRLLETQQTMERDYWRARQAENRYRLLFKIANEAVFVVDAETQRILDANIAAGRLLGATPEKLVGRLAMVCVDRERQAAVEELLATARLTGRLAELSTTVVGGREEMRLSVTPFRSDGATLLLMRAETVGRDKEERPLASALELAALVERIPDALVVADGEGCILMTNPAFLDLAQLVSKTHAEGRSLADWVGRPGSDLSMILAIARNHGSVQLMPTSVLGEHGRRSEVELSAAVVPGSDGQLIGFILRNVARRSGVVPTDARRDLGLAVQCLTELVGRVPLPDLVRDTTDLLERDFIRTALELTGGNRTTAAEILGLSRQSLYVKLRRHGLGSDDVAGASAAPLPG